MNANAAKQPEAIKQVPTSDSALPPGVTPAYAQLLQSRTANREAAFFLPHVRPGIRLLDCGCGHGTITVGLAEAIAPGNVTGIDLDAGRIAAASSLAAERGIDNVEFQVADITALPFSDASFNAVFEHAAFMYLDDPIAAAQEVRRVLRPGGVFGMRDTDLTATFIANSNPLMEAFRGLIHAWYADRGTDVAFGRRQREVLHAAGFARIEAGASCDNHGTPESVRTFAATMIRLLQGPNLMRFAAASGWGDAGRIAQVCAALETWGDNPVSFHAGVMGETVAWKA